MADLKEWYNADGLKVRMPGYHGQKRVRKNAFVEVKTSGNYREAICHYDLTLIPTTTISYSTDRNNDGTLDGFNSGDFYIPANSTVMLCHVHALVTAVGGTDLEIGGYQESGTVIDRDGLVTAAAAAVANLTASKVVIGIGANMTDANGEAGVGALNYYLGIYANGTYTAGTGKVVVRWVDPAA